MPIDLSGLTDTFAARVLAEFQAAGWPEHVAVAAALRIGSPADLERAVADAADIRNRCRIAGMPERATEFVRAGMTPDAAGRILLDALADADEATHTDTARRLPPTEATANAWAQRAGGTGA